MGNTSIAWGIEYVLDGEVRTCVIRVCEGAKCGAYVTPIGCSENICEFVSFYGAHWILSPLHVVRRLRVLPAAVAPLCNHIYGICNSVRYVVKLQFKCAVRYIMKKEGQGPPFHLEGVWQFTMTLRYVRDIPTIGRSKRVERKRRNARVHTHSVHRTSMCVSSARLSIAPSRQSVRHCSTSQMSQLFTFICVAASSLSTQGIYLI